MSGTKCSCYFIVLGDKVWFDNLDPTAKEHLPEGFHKTVHSAARELKLSGCGAIGLTFSGNYKKNCSVRNALAKKFPQAKNVFIPDASGRQKRSNDD